MPSLPWIEGSQVQQVSGIVADDVRNDDSWHEASESPEQHYTRRYCKHVIDQFDVLELFGCDIPRELQRHSLSVAYVSLNLAPDNEVEGSEFGDLLQPMLDQPVKPLGSAASDSLSDSQPIDTSSRFDFVLDHVSKQGGRLVINGPAGAGKSTLLRWCAITAARQVINACSEDGGAPLNGAMDWRGRIPVLIRLRDCPNGRLPAANDLPKFLAKHLPAAPVNWMTDILASGRAIVLFDGVDEIHRDQRPLLAEEIGELLSAYPACTYVVTTRPGAVEPGWLRRLEFIEARVEPMSRQDREEFIEKWYRSAARELRHRQRAGEDLAITALRLNAELAEQSELAALATNPLLCAMICALYRERQEKLPETSAELSEALCHMLLHRRERETPGLADKHFLSTWRELQYSQKKGLLAEIAWHMVSRGDSSIDAGDAKAIVADTLDSTPGRKRGEASDTTQALVERSGLLRPATDDRIDFIHNALKEYLAATRVVETGSWKSLGEHADDPAWQPVILFSLALAPENFSSQLVQHLVARTESDGPTDRKTGSLRKDERKKLALSKARKFFLVRCRAAAKRMSADLSNNIDNFIEELLPPTSMNEVEALALLGPRIISYGTNTLRKPNWWMAQGCHMTARCLRLLRLIGGPRAKEIFLSLPRLPSDSSQVYNEWLLAFNEICPGKRVTWPFAQRRSLYLSSSAITDISALADLHFLQFVDISHTGLNSLSPLERMEELHFLKCRGTSISDLSPLSRMTSLQHIDISYTPVADLTPLAKLGALETLACVKTKVVTLPSFGNLVNLKDINLSLTGVTDLSPLSALSKLERLSLNWTKTSDLSALSELPALNRLTAYKSSITDLSPIFSLTSLRFINLSWTKVSDLTPLSALKFLIDLSLQETQVSDLTPLVELKSLANLNLNNTDISDLSALAELIKLNDIKLAETKISDLSPLRNLENLRTLDIRRTRISDLTPLKNLLSLERIYLAGTVVTDLTPLVNIPALKFVFLCKNDTINNRALNMFHEQRPDVNLSRY